MKTPKNCNLTNTPKNGNWFCISLLKWTNWPRCRGKARLVWRKCRLAVWFVEVFHLRRGDILSAACLWAPENIKRWCWTWSEQNIERHQSRRSVMQSLTASLRQIFFSSFVFLDRMSRISCSFFRSSDSFSFFCSSLISESAEPAKTIFWLSHGTQNRISLKMHLVYLLFTNSSLRSTNIKMNIIEVKW